MVENSQIISPEQHVIDLHDTSRILTIMKCDILHANEKGYTSFCYIFCNVTNVHIFRAIEQTLNNMFPDSNIKIERNGNGSMIDITLTWDFLVQTNKSINKII